MLELSGIARSTYYYYLKQKDKDKYESEKQDILEIYNTHKGRYGYRRICSELKAKGYPINHKTVLKLMRSLHLRGKQSKTGKYQSYKGEVGKVADNLLKRKFQTDLTKGAIYCSFCYNIGNSRFERVIFLVQKNLHRGN